MIRRAPLACPAVLLMIAACSGGDGGSGGGGDVPIDQVGDQLAEVSCAQVFECCDEQERMDQLGFGISSEQDCVAFISGFAGGLLEPAIQRGVDQNRTQYDGRAMGSCLSALRGADCAQVSGDTGDFTAFPGCESAIVGLVESGGTCASDFECASRFCNGDETDLNGNVTQEGVCADKPTQGQACPDDECAGNTFCDSSQMCAERLPADSTCSFDDQCASDNCIGDSSGPGTCGAEPACDGV